jgi:Ca2+-dependent lipid-binding protein
MEVRIFEAKGLLAADAGGTSDPFAVLKLLDEERNPLVAEEDDDKKKKKKKKKGKPIPDRKTETFKKTLEPKWNETFTYEKAPPSSALVQVVVYDDDRFGKEALGMVEIEVGSLTRGTTSDKWYDLLQVPGMKEEPTGQLRIAMSVAADGETIEELGIRRFEEMVLGWDPHPDNVEHDEDDHVHEHHEGEPNELRVAVIKARDLPVMDSAVFGSGSSDPVAKVTVGRQTQNTSVKKKTLEPVWREVLLFDTDDDNDVVDIVLEDWDLVGSNDFMGKVSVQVGSLRGEHTQRQWHPLQPKSGRLEDLKGEMKGEVELALKWAYNPTRDPNRLFEAMNLKAIPDATPNELHVAVVKGRGLLAMDKSMLGGAGTSDPLVKLECGDRGGPHGKKATYKTKSISKTLDPKWEETFAFHIPSVELGGPDEPPPLSVVVEDWDLTGNDFMGRVDIPLQPLHDQHTEQAWYPLVGKDGVFDRERGQIQLLIKWVFNEQLELTYFDDEDDGQPDKPPNELRVCLVQARNIPIMDKNLIGGGGSSDPLAKCKVGDMPAVQTAVKKKTLDPVWNEVFKFEVKNPKLEIDIIVEDWDSMSGNDFIGMARLPLQDLANKQPVSKWLTLAGKYPKKATADAKPDYSKPRGDIEVALHWWYNPELDHQFFSEYDNDEYPELSPNQLLVAVTHAKDLLVMDKSMFSSGPGSSDPLVKLRIASSDEKLLPPKDDRRKWVKTEAQKKTIHPIWNESFTFNLSADEHIEGCDLELEVEDWDRIGSNDFMGRLVLPVAPFVDKKIHVEEHILLDKKGQADKHRGVLEVIVRWVYNPHLYPKYFLDDEDGDLLKHPNELKIAVVRARNLNIMDAHFIGKGGSSDPMVTISCDDSTYRTTVKKKDLHPVWNETFTVPVTDEALSLTLTLEDWDQIGGNDFMGRLVFPLKDFFDRKVRQRWYPLGGPNDADLAEEEVGEDGAVTLVKPPDKDRGELEVAVKWWYNAELNPQFFIGEADKFPGRAPNELRICVVRAVNLIAMDTSLFSKSKGTSDPYVIMKVGDEAPVQTTIKKKNLAPMWCEQMAIPALNVDAELEVTVMDWDLAGSHDFMGRVIIPLEPLFDKEPDQSWHVIGGKQGAEDGESRGEIELSLHWWFNPELEPDFFLEVSKRIH